MDEYIGLDMIKWKKKKCPSLSEESLISLSFARYGELGADLTMFLLTTSSIFYYRERRVSSLKVKDKMTLDF